MSTTVNFNGKLYTEPSVGAMIKSGIPIPPIVGSTGNVVLIDDGIGVGFGGGSGINGTNKSGIDSVYKFTDSLSAQNFVRGGIIWDLISYLFSPSKNANGANALYIVRAATTVAASSGAIDWDTDAGSVTFQAVNEGTVGNGAKDITTGVLTKGYGWKIIAGVVDSSKFIIQFYQGDFRGLDSNNNNLPYDVAEDDVRNHLILQSPEFSTNNDLIAWMTNDYYFNLYFKLTASSASATVLNASNLATYTGFQLLSGGSESYSSDDMDSVLAVIGDLDNSLFLAGGYGANALSVTNLKLEAHILNDANYGKIMFVGGGKDHTKFSGAADASIEVAQTYDDERVVVVHSGIKMPASIQGQIAYKYLPSIYHAALWCGRGAGVGSQVSLTYKDIRISGVIDPLNKEDRVRALQAGVGHTRFVDGLGWVINQGINTIQTNTNMVNQDGTSNEISIVRIEDQLNKELILNSSILFIGSNIGQITAADIKAWVEGYLQSKIATPSSPNLIVGFQNVSVVLNNGAWNVTYCFFLNSPINKMFYTGIILDPNISA